MYQQGQIRYNHELATLIDLVKSNTPESERVIEVLKTGDEEVIRHMLRNFGSPEDYVWKDITSASPWSDWQIDQAVLDLKTIKPVPDALGTLKLASTGRGTFWAW